MSLATKNRFTSKLGNAIEVKRGVWTIFTYGSRPNIQVRGSCSDVYRVVNELVAEIERDLEEGEEA